MLSVAVIGAGYWGPNLIRNFVTCPDTRLVAVCDQSTARLDKVLAPYPSVAKETDVDALLRRRDIDAVAIATPVRTHAPFALKALEAGKHVLVEKPFADSVEGAERMVELADRLGLTLMVDHTFVYSPSVRKIRDLHDAGELGELCYIDGVRINLGMFQHDVNVVWDLAPHDLSIVDYLLGRLPLSLSAVGACHTRGSTDLEDVAHLNLDFGEGLLASFHVNWLSPVKVRSFIVGGLRQSVVWNDLDASERVKVYDRGITTSEDAEARRGILINYRTGDVWSPHIEQAEPLQTMVKHFAECVREKKRSLTDGASGLRIVRILEAADRSLKSQGARISF
ncbi:MAG: putative dehydrogenase [Labilithrix sp.]|nr:putative dehydrogenase [Labilithrix sp.]